MILYSVVKNSVRETGAARAGTTRTVAGGNSRKGWVLTLRPVGAADAQRAHGRKIDRQVEQVHGDAGGGDGAERAQRDGRARGRRAADLHPGHARQQARAQHAHCLLAPIHQARQPCAHASAHIGL